MKNSNLLDSTMPNDTASTVEKAVCYVYSTPSGTNYITIKKKKIYIDIKYARENPGIKEGWYLVMIRKSELGLAKFENFIPIKYIENPDDIIEITDYEVLKTGADFVIVKFKTYPEFVRMLKCEVFQQGNTKIYTRNGKIIALVKETEISNL